MTMPCFALWPMRAAGSCSTGYTRGMARRLGSCARGWRNTSRFWRKPISCPGSVRAAKNCTSSIRCRSTRSPNAGSASSSLPDCAHFQSSKKTWKENTMTEAAKSSFVYVTYIRTTPEKLWAALTTSEFINKCWFGMNFETDWKPGSAWKLVFPDGRVADAGEIVELDRPRRIVLTWRHEREHRPELAAEGDARCVIEIEPA